MRARVIHTSGASSPPCDPVLSFPPLPFFFFSTHFLTYIFFSVSDDARQIVGTHETHHRYTNPKKGGAERERGDEREEGAESGDKKGRGHFFTVAFFLILCLCTHRRCQ